MIGILFSPEQAMLADIATRFFRDKWSVESTREQLTSDTGFDRDLWAEMTDAGWLGIAVPEELGGTGLERSSWSAWWSRWGAVSSLRHSSALSW